MTRGQPDNIGGVGLLGRISRISPDCRCLSWTGLADVFPTAEKHFGCTGRDENIEFNFMISIDFYDQTSNCGNSMKSSKPNPMNFR